MFPRRATMLARAEQIDEGFDINVLADVIATLDRLADHGLPVPDGTSAAELRAFYADTANPDDFNGAEGLVEVVALHLRPNNL